MLVNKPPMGWNTWSTFGSRISDRLIRESTDAFDRLGLREAGYEYVVIDDCWSKRTRDSKTNRLVADPEKFPQGMKALADYVHGKGLKFGMYSCAGQRTCADYPGSFDHEFLDAETFAEWGVDFLKYDFCYKPHFVDGPLLYRRMGMALRASGRDILFSACNWGSDNVWAWIRSAGAHMYRSTGDIFDTPESYRKIAVSQLDKLGASAPQCFNDVDMLTVGMYGNGNDAVHTGCSDADYRSEFVLWCMFSAPLILGCDIRIMNEATRKLVTNPELIRIDQDAECRPPMALNHPWNENLRILFKHLDDGSYALGLFNMDEKDAEIPVNFSELGLPAHAGYDLHVRNILEGGEETYREYMRVLVPAHDCKVYRAELVRQ